MNIIKRVTVYRHLNPSICAMDVANVHVRYVLWIE